MSERDGCRSTKLVLFLKGRTNRKTDCLTLHYGLPDCKRRNGYRRYFTSVYWFNNYLYSCRPGTGWWNRRMDQQQSRDCNSECINRIRNSSDCVYRKYHL